MELQMHSAHSSDDDDGGDCRAELASLQVVPPKIHYLASSIAAGAATEYGMHSAPKSPLAPSAASLQLIVYAYETQDRELA